MKGLTVQRKQMYKEKLAGRFGAELGKLDAAERRYIDEVMDALSFACTLQQPRCFQGVMRSADDFRNLLDTIDFDRLCVAAQAIISAEQRSAIRNRWWYIMGVLLKSSQPRQHRQAVKPRFDYEQRTYTEEELRSVNTSIESLKDLKDEDI